VLVEGAFDFGGEIALTVASWLVGFDVGRAEFDQDSADVLMLELDGPIGSSMPVTQFHAADDLKSSRIDFASSDSLRIWGGSGARN
jgi:hypothetical protein